MSLRARLALVLAGVMAGPLVAAGIVVGLVLPQQAAEDAVQQAQAGAASLAVALRQECRALGDLTQGVAAELAAPGQPVTTAAARDAVERASARRPGVHVGVLDAQGTVLAVDVPETPELRAGPLAMAYSCSAGTGNTVTAMLEEHLTVQLTVDGDNQTAADVVTWLPLTEDSLAALARAMAINGDVALLPPAGPGPTQPLVVTGGRRLDAVLADLADGRGEAPAGGRAYAVQPVDAGQPYRVLVAVPTQGPGQTSALIVGLLLVALAVAGLLVVLLAARLTRPLDHLAAVAERFGSGDHTARTGLSGTDEVGRLGEAFDRMAGELQGTVAQLRSSRDALSDTFARFGEALGRTHDLAGLLETVLDAAMGGADGAVGAAYLGDTGGLEEHASSVADGAPASVSGAFADLSDLALRAVRELRPVGTAAVECAGPALAVPLRSADRVVGALALARWPEARAYEDAALAAVHALADSAGIAVANVMAHDETSRLSVTDALTGAGNFRQLSTTLSREVERANRFDRPLAILMLDLDHFKDVNDAHGHAFGDAVLREFARRLQTCVREVDTVARYGGEEFTVILPETDPTGASRVAARIVDVVHAQPFVVGRRTRVVTVSAGVAALPEHGRTGAELMRAADAALYAAKSEGRNRWSLAESGAARARRGSVDAG